MNHYMLCAFSNPVPGREEEFNDWYTNQHLDDVLRIREFVAAQRFKLADDNSPCKWQYLTVYEYIADEPEGPLNTLLSRANSEEMPVSSAMGGYATQFWVAITDKKYSSNAVAELLSGTS